MKANIGLVLIKWIVCDGYVVHFMCCFNKYIKQQRFDLFVLQLTSNDVHSEFKISVLIALQRHTICLHLIKIRKFKICVPLEFSQISKKWWSYGTSHSLRLNLSIRSYLLVCFVFVFVDVLLFTFPCMSNHLYLRDALMLCDG